MILVNILLVSIKIAQVFPVISLMATQQMQPKEEGKQCWLFHNFQKMKAHNIICSCLLCCTTANTAKYCDWSQLRCFRAAPRVGVSVWFHTGRRHGDQRDLTWKEMKLAIIGVVGDLYSLLTLCFVPGNSYIYFSQVSSIYHVSMCPFKPVGFFSCLNISSPTKLELLLGVG